MEIKEINQQELELMCVDVLTQTYADLGQKDNDPQNKVDWIVRIICCMFIHNYLILCKLLI